MEIVVSKEIYEELSEIQDRENDEVLDLCEEKFVVLAENNVEVEGALGEALEEADPFTMASGISHNCALGLKDENSKSYDEIYFLSMTDEGDYLEGRYSLSVESE